MTYCWETTSVFVSKDRSVRIKCEVAKLGDLRSVSRSELLDLRLNALERLLEPRPGVSIKVSALRLGALERMLESRSGVPIKLSDSRL